MLLNDLRPEAELRAEIDSLEGVPIDYRLGHERAAWLEKVDAVIPSPGVPREDIKDELRTVDDTPLNYFFNVALLRRAEIVVEQKHVSIDRRGGARDFLELASPN